jgi:prepilin-type N-terminal cleavage/methylation domain-containing protein
MEKKKLNKRNKGFTLVELVVVIAILGILAMIAVPRLLGFQDRAKAQADNQTAAQVKNAMGLLYANSEINVSETSGAGTMNESDKVVFTITKTSTGATALGANGAYIKYTTSTFVKKPWDYATGTTNTNLAIGDLATKLSGLITDIKLVGTNDIVVTVDGAGAVSAVLEAPAPAST